MPGILTFKKVVEKVQMRFTKMVNNIEGKSYEQRLHCLKLWTLEARRNRQDLIEIFKTYKGMSRIELNQLFTLDRNAKSIRGHSFKLGMFRCTQGCCRYFFPTE